MKIDIRRSFVKDADKMPSAYQQQLAIIIAEIEKASRPAQLNHCKKLSGFKAAYLSY